MWIIRFKCILLNDRYFFSINFCIRYEAHAASLLKYS